MRIDHRLALGALILATAAPAGALQLDVPPVVYPELARSAANAEGFTPRGWRLERRAAGDLNGDGAADLALVFRMTDQRNIVRHDIMGENPFDTNPRILAVALAVPGGGYRLAVRNHTLIPRRDIPAQDDPFGEDAQGMSIARGAIRIGLHRFMSAGGWSMGNTAFTLRWQDGALRLIGYDNDSVQRNTGVTTTLSINYLTRRARIATGSIENDRERVRWRQLRPAPLLTIEAIGDGLEFDPDGLLGSLP